ncbi:MAG: pyruvate dehydrogenase (acetyl-transferring) E1 component subunit alpha [Acetobacter sp.]|nr:pyruvate dehydrogenase (acetyl-transferring) E1 component subunit alpha [Acetobacter sp.]
MQEAELQTDGFADDTKKLLTRDQFLNAYRIALLIRRFEEKVGQLYSTGFIGGFCHLYIGEEAVATGITMNLRSGDKVITSYRDHGYMLALGIDPRSVMAELTGRATGCSRGKGGSMHMYSREKNFYGGCGIVGAQVPLGVGLAFANRYRGTDEVAITCFGDGANNQGQVYESYNLASLHKLPCVFVIENNHYGMGTSVERSSASHNLYKNGEPWGIPGLQVDGMDVAAVHAAVKQAVTYCREGKGPYLLEMMTYRYRGHSMSDPAKYRTREEVDHVRKTHDPIEHIKNILLEDGEKENTLQTIDDEIKAIVNDAAEFAQTSPEPEAQELYTNVVLEA